MRTNLPSIPPQSTTGAARFSYYADLVKANGGKVEEGKATVLGLRGINPSGERHASNENVGPYNDTFVLLQNGECTEFIGSCHAGQKSSSLSPRGVAQIRPGNYITVPNGNFHEMPSYHVRITPEDASGLIPCWRDTNKDGIISNREKSKAEAENEKATEILLHNGRRLDHGTSIGCQTMPPKVMQSFISKVGVDNGFYYSLVDANLPTPG